MTNTDKLYYKAPYLTKCIAKVVDKKVGGIVCDKTIAFPEGGGQGGDKGLFYINKENKEIEIPYVDTQKGHGRKLHLKDFPAIVVEAPIVHKVAETDVGFFEIGDEVQIFIDVQRRAKMTVNHSAIHLALLGLEKFYPNISSQIKGAEIKEDGARLDFFDVKFTPEILDKVKEYVNSLIREDKKIDVFHHQDEWEAWYWKCENFIVPCGGTHLPSTKYIGDITLKRKNKGSNCERIIIECPMSKLPLELYHY